jgi:hypothetical protein
MPFSINETYQANWAGGEMGLVGAAQAEGHKVIEAAVAGDGRKAFDEIMEMMKGTGGNATNQKGAAAEIGGGIAGTVLGNDNIKNKALKSIGGGVTINPYWELFFSGVQPRTFTFDFKMSPKNSTEGAAIQQIIQMFKTYAAPPANIGDSRRYWGYPSLFDIEYWNTEKLHKLKPCALQSIVVNYSGDGTNHTYYDGRPIQTDLTLTFMESELLTRQQIQGGY